MSNPTIIFHISHGFHRWFVFTKGDFNVTDLRKLGKAVALFASFWTQFENKILDLIPTYTGAPWPFTEIHAYFFQAPPYSRFPCIADPLLIRVDDSNEMNLLFMLHELVHHNIMLNQFYKNLSDEIHEITAYFVAAQVLRDILSDKAEDIITRFTQPWPYDFPRLVRQYGDKINLHDKNMKKHLKIELRILV